MLQLVIVKGPSNLKGQRFDLTDGSTVTVGRSTQAEIHLPSSGVSKMHCRLVSLSGGRVEVQDLGSSNGTYVNGLLIKKHVARVGDIISVHGVAIQIKNPSSKPVSNLNILSGDESPRIEMVSEDAVQVPVATKEIQEPQGRLASFVSDNFFPLADSLASKFDLRILVVSFFVLWSALLIILTASPFMTKANERVREQSAAVASLYARQLVRINQQAIVDQQYNQLITKLDGRIGDTKGLITALIIDAENNQILAPPEFLGRSLPSKEAVIAARQDKELVQYTTKEGIELAYASAPIKVGSSDGNKTAAVAFVEFNTMNGQFTGGALVDQVVNSLLVAIVLSLFVFIFLYRWLEGSLKRMSQSVDESMQKGQYSIVTGVKWPVLEELAEHVSAALGRAASGGGINPVQHSSSSGDWAIAAVQASGSASAAFNAGLVVVAWNEKMEQVIGIRSSLAMGQEIASASRDIAFETAIRELSAECKVLTWSKQTRDIEFGGNPYKVVMVYGDGAHLVNIIPIEGG